MLKQMKRFQLDSIAIGCSVNSKSKEGYVCGQNPHRIYKCSLDQAQPLKSINVPKFPWKLRHSSEGQNFFVCFRGNPQIIKTIRTN